MRAAAPLPPAADKTSRAEHCPHQQRRGRKRRSGQVAAPGVQPPRSRKYNVIGARHLPRRGETTIQHVKDIREVKIHALSRTTSSRADHAHLFNGVNRTRVAIYPNRLTRTEPPIGIAGNGKRTRNKSATLAGLYKPLISMLYLAISPQYQNCLNFLQPGSLPPLS